MTSISLFFQPVLDQFSQTQLQIILMAWLPTKLESYLSGIFAVDTYLISIITAGLTALLAYLWAVSNNLFSEFSWGQNLITVQVEYYITGIYGDQSTSTLYEALSWLISSQTKKLGKGAFIVQPMNAEYGFFENEEDDCAPPEFNVLPERGQDITIIHKDRKFKVTFQMPITDQQNSENNASQNNYRATQTAKPMPSIYLTTIEDKKSNVDSVSEFIGEVTRKYLEDKKKKRTRGRYERGEGYWYRIQALGDSRGLDTVALDEPQEKLMIKELNTFVKDKDFYSRIGMPYRRGILLYGKPGTGKTSLINAISAHLNRDLYFLNLKSIKQDNELSAAFSGVPSNQIIVLEDVDTMTRVVHKRSRKEKFIYSDSTGSSSKDNSQTSEEKPKGVGPDMSNFSLSTFLGCLDGHILSEGTIIIMTTNHIEYLDPAVIRPGRMDLRLDLGYCTHYQIEKMYRGVTENSKAEFPKEILENIPERILPPCEVMMTMVLYRNEPEVIPHKVLELVGTYRDKEWIPEELLYEEEEEMAKQEQAKMEQTQVGNIAEADKANADKSEVQDDKNVETTERENSNKLIESSKKLVDVDTQTDDAPSIPSTVEDDMQLSDSDSSTVFETSSVESSLGQKNSILKPLMNGVKV